MDGKVWHDTVELTPLACGTIVQWLADAAAHAKARNGTQGPRHAPSTKQLPLLLACPRAVSPSAHLFPRRTTQAGTEDNTRVLGVAGGVFSSYDSACMDFFDMMEEAERYREALQKAKRVDTKMAAGTGWAHKDIAGGRALGSGRGNGPCRRRWRR